jgi:hypothetical protein
LDRQQEMQQEEQPSVRPRPARPAQLAPQPLLLPLPHAPSATL